jgi:hypothetical protein
MPSLKPPIEWNVQKESLEMVVLAKTESNLGR